MTTPPASAPLRPAVFLDRDGTINEDVGYLSELSHLTLYPWAIDAVRLLNRAGQVMQVPVAITDRPAAGPQPATVVAEIALAPLAAGEYVLELTATSGERSESRTYAIRMVP